MCVVNNFCKHIKVIQTDEMVDTYGNFFGMDANVSDKY